MSRTRMPSPFGWDPSRQPVDWSYSVAFKKPRGGKLFWVDSGLKDVVEASKAARVLVAMKQGGGAYNEYGVSKSYWRIWDHAKESITSGEYEEGLRHKAEWRQPVL